MKKKGGPCRWWKLIWSWDLRPGNERRSEMGDNSRTRRVTNTTRVPSERAEKTAQDVMTETRLIMLGKKIGGETQIINLNK